VAEQFKMGFDSPFLRKFSVRVANLQGTQSYWWRESLQLQAAMDEKASPTFFFSLSAADYRWQVLQQYMPWPKDVIANGLEKLTVKQKKK